MAMDPAEIFPIDIVEGIFSHLGGAELKNLSLVSPKWSKVIGSSSLCMRRLKLMLMVESGITEDVKKILIDGRKYQNISISDPLFEDGALDFVGDVLNMRQDWKSVEIYCFSFPSTSDYHKLLKMFESTVEHLVLSGVTIDEAEQTKPEFDFKRLKSLKITHSDKTIDLSLFSQSPLLNALDFCTSRGRDTSNIIEFLECHDSLRSLRLNTRFFNIVFSSKTANFEFNLEQLTITNYGAVVRVDSTEETFLLFLQKQAATLKKLRLDDWHGLSIMRQAFEMKALTEVKFANLPMLDWDTTNFSTSKSIEILDVSTVNTRNIRKMKAILSSVPNLRQLRLRSIDYEIVTFIRQNLKSLEKIKLVHPNRDAVNKLPNVECE